MRVHVVEPPVPIVTPADVPGDHDAGDALIAALIAAVTESIDGPTGWLGRSLGVQTLEARLDGWWDSCRQQAAIQLPYPPIIGVDYISYIDANGAEQLLDDEDYTFSGDTISFGSWSPPVLGSISDPVRIMYRAGYDGDTTPVLPERVRQFIIYGVQMMLVVNPTSAAVKSEEVAGIGKRQYVEVDGSMIRKVSEQMLSGLAVRYL